MNTIARFVSFDVAVPNRSLKAFERDLLHPEVHKPMTTSLRASILHPGAVSGQKVGYAEHNP